MTAADMNTSWPWFQVFRLDCGQVYHPNQQQFELDPLRFVLGKSTQEVVRYGHRPRMRLSQ
jgi:hypothetical protein